LDTQSPEYPHLEIRIIRENPFSGGDWGYGGLPGILWSGAGSAQILTILTDVPTPSTDVNTTGKPPFLSILPTVDRSGRRSVFLTCPYLVGPESHILRRKIRYDKVIPGRLMAAFSQNLVVSRGK